MADGRSINWQYRKMLTPMAHDVSLPVAEEVLDTAVEDAVEESNKEGGVFLEIMMTSWNM